MRFPHAHTHVFVPSAGFLGDPGAASCLLYLNDPGRMGMVGAMASRTDTSTGLRNLH